MYSENPVTSSGKNISALSIRTSKHTALRDVGTRLQPPPGRSHENSWIEIFNLLKLWLHIVATEFLGRVHPGGQRPDIIIIPLKGILSTD